MIKIGDLVQIRGTSIVDLVTRVESVANFYKALPPTTWVILNGGHVRKASKLEVINERR